ncbi:antibiotic biosynthesis monooxygenase family protein [Cytobacillus massiliigabonensis]|uniref:antibiotic biosynthesis monooxygenase family protein n=1 Tax=Cytobacillus massiliigabonensis TaxID=1871011 RepID=UPI0015E1588E|nr:antibiotic biosynthesis monooxygenase [Cytobacillus massiliigabonensis]
MYVYMTTGTYNFLYKIKDKHHGESMFLMQNIENALLLHESNQSSIFKTPRSFQVIDSNGIFENKGIVVMNTIPITEEERPLLEHRFHQLKTLLKNQRGLSAIRFLRPLKGSDYVILSLWQNEKSYADWENSTSFAAFKKELETFNNPANLLIGSAYVTKYFIPENE